MITTQQMLLNVKTCIKVGAHHQKQDQISFSAAEFERQIQHDNLSV